MSVAVDGAAIWVSVVVRYTTVASRTVETGETVTVSTTVRISVKGISSVTVDPGAVWISVVVKSRVSKAVLVEVTSRYMTEASTCVLIDVKVTFCVTTIVETVTDKEVTVETDVYEDV